MGKWRNSSFYQQDMMSSASLFAREIILNPSAAEANKPTWFNSWGGQLLMQFAGYPTAFNNIVLKGMARDLVRGQGVGGRTAGAITNAPKTLGALSVMTGMASITNTIRSYGANLDNEEKLSDIPFHTNLTVEAIRRWGGLGPYEYLYRYTQGRKYGGGQTGAALKSFPGPLAADVFDAIAYRQSLLEVGVQNIPGWSSLPYPIRKEIRDWSRTKNEEPISVGHYARGGLVNVPNTPAEPDDRLMRNDVNTFKDAAGFIVDDLEDRQGFQEGSEVTIPNTPSDPADRQIRGGTETFNEVADRPNFAATDFSEVIEGNEAIKWLTQNTDISPTNEYRRDDPTPINTYTQGDIELENVGTDRPYYTSLPENTNFAWRNDIRQSLGRLVVDNPEDLPKENDVQIEGRVKYTKAIPIDSDSLNSNYLIQVIKNLDKKDIVADSDLSFDTIQNVEEESNQWNSVLNNITEKTEQVEQLKEQTMGSRIRNAFLKLGIDALEFKNGSGFVLLRTNQFFPTRIVNIKRKGFAFGSLATTLKDRKLRNQVNNVADSTLGSQMDQLGLNRQRYALGGVVTKALRKLFLESLKRYTRFIGEIDGVKIQRLRKGRTTEEAEQEFLRQHPNRPLPTKKPYQAGRQADLSNYNLIKNAYTFVAPNPEPLAKMKNETPLKEGASDLRENLIVLEKALSLRGDRSTGLLNRMYDILDPSKSKEGEKRIIDFLKFFNTSGDKQTYNIQGYNKTIKDFQPYLPFKFDDKTGRYIDIKAEKPDITGQPTIETTPEDLQAQLYGFPFREKLKTPQVPEPKNILYIDEKKKPRGGLYTQTELEAATKAGTEKARIKEEDKLKSTSGEQPRLGDKVSNTLTDPSLTTGGYDPVDLPPMASKTDELRQAQRVAMAFESKILAQPEYKKLRTNIMNAWKETGYTGKQLQEDDNVFDVFNQIVQDFIPDRNIAELGLDDETDIVVSSIFEEIIGRQKFWIGSLVKLGSKLAARLAKRFGKKSNLDKQLDEFKNLPSEEAQRAFLKERNLILKHSGQDEELKLIEDIDESSVVDRTDRSKWLLNANYRKFARAEEDKIVKRVKLEERLEDIEVVDERIIKEAEELLETEFDKRKLEEIMAMDPTYIENKKFLTTDNDGLGATLTWHNLELDLIEKTHGAEALQNAMNHWMVGTKTKMDGYAKILIEMGVPPKSVVRILKPSVGKGSKALNPYAITYHIPAHKLTKNELSIRRKFKEWVIANFRAETEDPDAYVKPLLIDFTKGRDPRQGGGLLSKDEDELPPDAYREDGSLKSATGFLGPIVNNETGKTQTELSVTFGDVLGGRPIPLLVSTLTEEDQDWFRENDAEGNPKSVPDSIKQKAIIHALERDKEGLDPFYQDGE